MQLFGARPAHKLDAVVVLILAMTALGAKRPKSPQLYVAKATIL
jgi:hypothetical protein